MQLVCVDRSGPHLDEVRTLLGEYWRAFGFTPCFQGFDEELANLPGAYGPPRGALLLAPGTGLGRSLAQAAVARGRESGFSRIVLDTIAQRMPEAVALYASMGFHPIPSYSGTPGALCMELVLR
jgi:putative acetyltransferase